MPQTPSGREVPAVEPGAVPADAFLLDVREPDEWVAGHAPGAVHLPLGQLQSRVGELPEDRDVYVICRSGGRSAQATAFLGAEGRSATNVEGGMQRWAATGRRMVSETEAEPEVA